ncbi:MAG: Fic family protein [Patescibacteria group bacterium]
MPEYRLKKLPLEDDFNTTEILNLSLRVDNALSDLDKEILKISNFELILQPLTVREAVASNEIESIRTTTLEILQAELLNPQTLPSAQKEVLHYKKSLLLGLSIVKDEGKLLLEDLINIHCGIVPNKAGLRNRGGVYVGNRLGEIIYTPPQELAEIKDYLNNLFDYIYSTQSNSLVKIILTHYQLEAIHPFFDGNGRVGRILMSLQFVLEKKLQYPVLYSSGYIAENKSVYYELFREIQQNNNWHDWIIFHLNGILRQAKEATMRVREIQELKNQFTYRVSTALKLPKTKQKAVQEYFFTKAFYTQTDMAKTLQMSRNTTKKYLTTLLNHNLLDTRQAGREFLYFIPEFIEILS